MAEVQRHRSCMISATVKPQICLVAHSNNYEYIYIYTYASICLQMYKKQSKPLFDHILIGYICNYTYVYVYIYIYILRILMYTYLCLKILYIYICVTYVYIHMYMYIYAYIFACEDFIHLDMYACMHSCMYACVPVYMNTHIHTCYITPRILSNMLIGLSYCSKNGGNLHKWTGIVILSIKRRTCAIGYRT